MRLSRRVTVLLRSSTEDSVKGAIAPVMSRTGGLREEKKQARKVEDDEQSKMMRGPLGGDQGRLRNGSGQVALWMRWSSRSSCLLGCARPLLSCSAENASLLPDPRSRWHWHNDVRGKYSCVRQARRCVSGIDTAVSSISCCFVQCTCELT
jgi:hypothetical protein